jgi:hypothetical protein
VSRAGAIAARKEDVPAVHLRSKFADQISAGALADASYAEAGLFSCAGRCFADCSHLQWRKYFTQIEANRGRAFGYGVDSVLAAEDDPFKLFLVQFAESVVELVKVKRRFDADDREQDRLGSVRAQRVGNRRR